LSMLSTNEMTEMPERQLRGALVGAGSIAPYHLTAWQQTPGVEIVAICNRTVERARALAFRFGIDIAHCFPDVDRLLDAEYGLDFVDIVTAPDHHRIDVETAATARVPHILCQKPFAPCHEDAVAMITAAESAGSTLTINENWRWRSWYRQLKSLLDGCRIGPVRYVRIAAHRNVTLGQAGERPPIMDRQPYTATMPRLIVFEWGIHLIDVMRWLLGEPQWVHAAMSGNSPGFRGEDRAVMTFGVGAAVASIDISWATQTAPELPTLLEDVVIEGDQGTISLSPNRGDGDLIRVVEALPIERLPEDRLRPWSPTATTAIAAHDGDIAAAYQRSFTAAHRHFAECWRSGTTPETDVNDNLKTLRVMFAAYRSAEANRVISIEAVGTCNESS
jgi:predicted dehydrogenase